MDNIREGYISDSDSDTKSIPDSDTNSNSDSDTLQIDRDELKELMKRTIDRYLKEKHRPRKNLNLDQQDEYTKDKSPLDQRDKSSLDQRDINLPSQKEKSSLGQQDKNSNVKKVTTTTPKPRIHIPDYKLSRAILFRDWKRRILNELNYYDVSNTLNENTSSDLSSNDREKLNRDQKTACNSNTPYINAILPRFKKDGTTRLCLDPKYLNARLQNDYNDYRPHHIPQSEVKILLHARLQQWILANPNSPKSLKILRFPGT